MLFSDSWLALISRIYHIFLIFFLSDSSWLWKRCSENSTLFLPDVCGIQYTGQGTLYDVLAGPIYLIIQGVAAVPLVGLIQSFSLRPPFAIGIITVLWSICTLITGFVKDYWAVALLRFLYGILYVLNPKISVNVFFFSFIKLSWSAFLVDFQSHSAW